MRAGALVGMGLLLVACGPETPDEPDEARPDPWLAALGAVSARHPLSLPRTMFRDYLPRIDTELQRFPDNSALQLAKATALYLLDREVDAIPAFQAARRLDPQLRDNPTITFQLAIAYSKQNDFPQAQWEYDRAIRLIGLHGDATLRSYVPTLYANEAECLMAMDHVEEASRLYALATRTTPHNVLAWWGLAVSLDRLGATSDAIKAVRNALRLDRQMTMLTADGTFFVPDGDVHYYFALGYGARGMMCEASASWVHFIETLPHSQWVGRARWHLSQLSTAGCPR